MRPYGTSEQLARRRQCALDLLRTGQTPTQVAKQLKTTPQSVRRWQQATLHPKPQRHRRALGRPSHLSAAQRRRLVVCLKRGAYAFGYAEEYWTLDRIAHLIWELFQVRYATSSVWYLMQQLGWSRQKPQRRSLARDDQAITHWKRYVWPQVKKVSASARDLDFSR